MADKKLNIKVSTPGAKKSKEQLQGVTGSINKLGKAALATGVAYFGARGLINGIKFATQAFGEQELAEKKLSTALGRTSKALLDQASALQQVTTFGDEATIEAMSLMAAFTKDEEVLKKLTVATMDYAAATGTDLNSAAQLVGRTFGTSMNAMSRYGVSVEGAAGSTKRLESLTGNLNNMFGGQAKAQAETYLGSVQQLKNELGDMAEDIGRILIPVFQDLQPHLQAGIDALGKILGKAEENEKVTSSYSAKIQETSEMIDLLRQRTDGLTASNIFQKRHTEEVLALLERARNRNVDTVVLLKAEKQALGELITEKFNLIKLHEREIELREAANVKSGISLQLRRAEIDMDIEYVDVIDPATKSNTLFAASFDDIAGASSTSLRQTSELLATTAGTSKKQQIQAMRLAQFAAVADTAAGVMKAFKQGGTLGFVTGAGIAAAGVGQIAAIEQAISNAQSAATGFDGVVNRPTMFLTGEAGPESVRVTPLTPGMNRNGPQGGITLNISAPLVDETVIDSIIPAIQKAQRMNLA